LRRSGKGQLSPLERLAKGLRMAADAWKELHEIHNDRLSDVRRFDEGEALGADLLPRGEPGTFTEPFAIVRRLMKW
jgi:hypothetical protein